MTLFNLSTGTLIFAILVAIAFIIFAFMELFTEMGDNNNRNAVATIYVISGIAIFILPFIPLGYLWIYSVICGIGFCICLVMESFGGTYNNNYMHYKIIGNIYSVLIIVMIILFLVSIGYNIAY